MNLFEKYCISFDIDPSDKKAREHISIKMATFSRHHIVDRWEEYMTRARNYEILCLEPLWNQEALLQDPKFTLQESLEYLKKCADIHQIYYHFKEIFTSCEFSWTEFLTFLHLVVQNLVEWELKQTTTAHLKLIDMLQENA